MECEQVRKLLLLYLDHDLSSDREQAIQSHLAHCSGCTGHLSQLQQLWQCPRTIAPVEASPWLWQRIVTELSAQKNWLASLTRVRGWISSHAVPIAAAALVVIGVLMGIYLGSVPQINRSETIKRQALETARADFIKTSHLDAFDDLPPASIGGVYLTLEANQPGGE